MTFSLTYADLLAASKVVVWRNTAARLWRVAGAVALGCGAYLALFSLDDGTGEVLLAAGFAAGFLTLPALGLASRRSPGVEPAHTTVELADDAIRITSEHRSSTYGWPAVRAVVVTGGHVFLVMPMRSAVTVPRGAFDDERSFAEFVTYARQRAVAAP